MSNLTAADILAVQDIHTEEITIPEWGGRLYIRSMTGQERDTWEVYAQGQMHSKIVNIRARLAAICLSDVNGKRLFTDADTAKLAEKSGAALDRIYAAAVRWNGLTNDEVEHIEKKS